MGHFGIKMFAVVVLQDQSATLPNQIHLKNSRLTGVRGRIKKGNWRVEKSCSFFRIIPRDFLRIKLNLLLRSRSPVWLETTL